MAENKNVPPGKKALLARMSKVNSQGHKRKSVHAKGYMPGIKKQPGSRP